MRRHIHAPLTAARPSCRYGVAQATAAVPSCAAWHAATAPARAEQDQESRAGGRTQSHGNQVTNPTLVQYTVSSASAFNTQGSCHLALLGFLVPAQLRSLLHSRRSHIEPPSRHIIQWSDAEGMGPLSYNAHKLCMKAGAQDAVENCGNLVRH